MNISLLLLFLWAFLVTQLVKNPRAIQETWVWSPSWEDPLEKGKATHYSILAWRIVHGVAKNWHNWATFTFHFFAGVFYFFICFKRIGNYFMKQFYVDCFKMFRQIISTAESPLCYCLLVVFSQINCDFPGLWYDQWFSPVPWIFFNTMLGNSWPFKNISSRQLPSLGLACGFYWLFRLSWHPHCGNPGPVLLITVRCGKSHFSHPFSPSPSRSIPHGFRAV